MKKACFIIGLLLSAYSLFAQNDSLSHPESFFVPGKTYLFKSGNLDATKTIIFRVVYDADTNVTITRMFKTSNQEILTNSSVFFPESIVTVIPASKPGESTKAEISHPENVWAVYFDSGACVPILEAANSKGGVLFIRAKKVTVIN